MPATCPPGALIRFDPTLPGGFICSTPIEYFCAPDEVHVCAVPGTPLIYCPCVKMASQAPAQMQCEVRVIYPPNNPAGAQLVTYPGCEGAGMELAIAVVLARLLGAPLP
jgi:hypothetical protein